MPHLTPTLGFANRGFHYVNHAFPYVIQAPDIELSLNDEQYEYIYIYYEEADFSVVLEGVACFLIVQW